jgi:Fur family zinc uptake transcriptional regulator
MSKRGEEKRAEILSFVRGAYGALSAYDVLSGPRSTHPTIGLSTVYNALATLTESGVIHRVESRKADIVCQCGGTHQAFVLSICDACGTAEERDASQLLKTSLAFSQSCFTGNAAQGATRKTNLQQSRSQCRLACLLVP